LRRLAIRTTAASVHVKTEALLADDSAGEIRMCLINARVHHRHGHTPAGVAERVDFVAADEGNALRERTGPADVEVDAPHKRIGFEPPNLSRIDVDREAGNVVPSRDQSTRSETA